MRTIRDEAVPLYLLLTRQGRATMEKLARQLAEIRCIFEAGGRKSHVPSYALPPTPESLDSLCHFEDVVCHDVSVARNNRQEATSMVFSAGGRVT
jgi:hypothetical protein